MYRDFPRRPRPALLLLSGITLLALALHASPAAAQAKKVVTIEGITEYKLDNGARYLLIPDQSTANVTVNMTVLVGSRHEGYGESGMAHLLEHMLFKGSKNFPVRYVKLLKNRGADFNGTTDFDRTNYYETMVGNDDNLKFALELEADRLMNSFIKEQDLRDEWPVVLDEFRIYENSPTAVLRNRLFAAAFEWHNYGKVTIGNEADVKNVPADRLRVFYKKYYRPDNIVLVVAGKFDEAKAHAHIARTFGAIPKPKAPIEATYTKEPAQDGERHVTLRRAGKGSMVGFMYHMPATAHPEFAALDVLESVLLVRPAGRLYKRLVEGKKADKIEGGTGLFHDPGVFSVYCTVRDGVNPEEVRDIIIDELENLKAKPITEEELERARRSMLADYEQRLTNTRKLAVELNEWIAAGDWRLLFLHRDRFKKVTVADLNRIGPKYFVQSNRTVGVFVPTGKEQIVRADVPQTPSLTAMLKDLKGGGGAAEGEAFDPSPENIERRLKRLELANGIKVALLPKKTRGETVMARLTLRFGNEQSLAEYVEASSQLGALMRRGTARYTYQQLEDELGKLQAKLNVSSDLGTLTLSVEAKRDTLPQVLNLARAVLREPSLPQKELDILKSNAKLTLEKAQTDPLQLALRTLRIKLNPYPKTHIRYQPTIPESLARLKQLTREQIVKLYQEQVGTGKGELVVIGDFDTAATVQQFEGMLADWKSKVPYRRIGREARIDVVGHRHDIVTPDKKNAMYLAGFTLALVDTDPDYLPLRMGNFILGEGTASRLWGRLRETESLSYQAGSILQVMPEDKYGIFVMLASTDPKNIDKADKAALEELEKIIKEGVSAADLQAARKALLQDQQRERGSDSSLLTTLSTGLYLGRTMDYYAKQEKAIAALPLDAVNRALRTYLVPGRLIIIRAGDFQKLKEAPK